MSYSAGLRTKDKMFSRWLEVGKYSWNDKTPFECCRWFILLLILPSDSFGCKCERMKSSIHAVKSARNVSTSSSSSFPTTSIIRCWTRSFDFFRILATEEERGKQDEHNNNSRKGSGWFAGIGRRQNTRKWNKFYLSVDSSIEFLMDQIVGFEINGGMTSSLIIRKKIHQNAL